jgi:hypothetical protein
MTPPGNGSLGAIFAPVQVQSGEAMVSALYRCEGKTYVRTYEYRGTGGKVSLRHALGHARVTQVDLAGHALGVLTNAFPVKPWEIKTVKLERSIE